ncbi:MAG: hypothetical protein AAFV62_11240 [Pseudomonadota bacterium]
MPQRLSARLLMLPLFGLLLTLGGCASGARSTAMVAPVTAETLIDSASPLHRAIGVGQTSGGEETNPLWTPEVSTGDFRRALETSLNLTTMLGPPSAPFTLDATLEELDQPVITLNFTVTATIFYRLRANKTGEIVWQERIAAPHTVNFTENFVRSERLRLASEGAVRENISVFLKQLNAVAKQDPYRFVNL